jgi:hypothetical protein
VDQAACQFAGLVTKLVDDPQDTLAPGDTSGATITRETVWVERPLPSNMFDCNSLFCGIILLAFPLSFTLFHKFMRRSIFLC